MKLDITALLESLLEEESNPGLRIRERRKPAKFREILEKICAWGDTISSLIRESFCGCYCILIDATDPCRKGVHETIKLSIWEGAVDPSIAFGRVSVKILTSNDDLERP